MLLEVKEQFRLSDFSSQLPHEFGFWNSGLIFHENSFILSCRNETSMHNERYFNRKVEKSKRWESYCPAFIYFDNAFNLIKASPIQKTDLSRYEDVRMFFWKNEIYCTGTVKSPDKGGVDQFLGKKFNDSIVRLRFQHPYKLHQKNWSPIVDDYNNLYFEYSPGPKRKLLNYRYPNLVETYNIDNKLNLRGNCQFIDIGSHFIAFYHFSKARDYYHQAAILEKNFPFSLKKISKPFKFSKGNEKIQFLTGAILHHDKVFLSYGVQDSDNILAYVELDFLKSVIGN